MLAIILSTKSQLKEEDSNATNPIEFSDFSKVVLSSSTLLKLLKPSVYKCYAFFGGYLIKSKLKKYVQPNWQNLNKTK
jgi:hypothetical protein